MTTCTLSLCIATFNRAPFLEETLRGIASQVSPDVEIVVIDGGSTDGTSAVVERFRGSLPALRYERRPEPGGVDRDFDLSVEAASGRYCWLMSDDDLMEPGALASVLARLQRHEPSVLIVNAAIYNQDFSVVLRTRALDMADDRVYERGQDERLFTDTANYLSFIGAVVVRRDLWLARERTSYFGSQFIHVGVLFQAALPAAAVVLAHPLIAIRYGNASWSSKAFEIWMFKWPNLIWSFDQFSDGAKEMVCRREPWRSVKKLLLHRAKGAYSIRDYQVLLRPRIPASLMRVKALSVALMPGTLCNLIAMWGVRVLYKESGVALADLRNSRFNSLGRLKASFSAAGRRTDV
jgi:glycosyltransferase involved in cell wall biosynthesis